MNEEKEGVTFWLEAFRRPRPQERPATIADMCEARKPKGRLALRLSSQRSLAWQRSQALVMVEEAVRCFQYNFWAADSLTIKVGQEMANRLRSITSENMVDIMEAEKWLNLAGPLVIRAMKSPNYVSSDSQPIYSSL